MTLVTRISLIVILITAAGFYLFVSKESDATKRRYREATEEPLVDFAHILAAIIETETSLPELPSKTVLEQALVKVHSHKLSAKIYDFEKTSVDLRVYITNSKGIVVFDSAGTKTEGQDYSKWRDVTLALKGEYGARTSHEQEDSSSGTLYVAAPIKFGQNIIGALTVGKPSRPADLFIAAARRTTLALGLSIFFGVVVLAIALTTIVSSPLKKLTSYAQAVRDGKRAPLPQLRSAELRDLGTAFEQMRIALEGKNYIEQYIQAITHEIKSPLSGIRGSAELLREDMPPEQRLTFISNIERETQRIQGLVEKLLALSALERTTKLEHLEPVEIGTLIERVITSVQTIAANKSVKLILHGSALRPVNADPFWLEQAFSSILNNAIEFSPKDSTVSIRIEQIDQQIQISITDQGPGIPEWAIDKVFDRFYSLARPESSQRSSGLGLTIAKEVFELHHGRISIRNQSPGGTTVEISL